MDKVNYIKFLNVWTKDTLEKVKTDWKMIYAMYVIINTIHNV